MHHSTLERRRSYKFYRYTLHRHLLDDQQFTNAEVTNNARRRAGPDPLLDS